MGTVGGGGLEGKGKVLNADIPTIYGTDFRVLSIVAKSRHYAMPVLSLGDGQR
jgi:hypothetical protein